MLRMIVTTALLALIAVAAASAQAPTADHTARPLQKQRMRYEIVFTAAPIILPGVIAAQEAMHRGTTSEALVERYLARIAAVDQSGPALRSIIALNPHALADARRLDAERKAGHVRGPLHGVPILIKDNIESDDDTATTAGSLALKDNVTHRDAPLVKRLKDAGAVILGKTNMSEWASSRSTHGVSGWSGIGGLVRNPYALDRSACGSSSGSGAAAAASLAAATVGTETDGSVTCPSSLNGLVGLKPTVGLVSRTHVIPITHVQDTAGPMGRSVEDVAALLTGMAGSDPLDPATAEADLHKLDYLGALSPVALVGKRIGVVRDAVAKDPSIKPLFETALVRLRDAGATLVEIELPKTDSGDEGLVVVLTELKADLNAYLATTPAVVKTRTLSDLIAFDKASPRELSLFGQDLFEQADQAKSPDDPGYRAAREHLLNVARTTIDGALAKDKLDAIVLPTSGAAYRVDVVDGDHDTGSSTTLPAVAGYPHLTVPMGQVQGLPVGLSFWGPKWSEARLLAFGFAYQEKGARFVPPTFRPSVEDGDAVQAAFRPAH